MIIIGVRGFDGDFDTKWNETADMIMKEIPSFFDKVTVFDAIGNLPKPTSNGEIENPIAISNFQKYLASNKNILTNHNMSNHSKIAIERMEKISSGENYLVLNEEINSVHSGAYGRLEWYEPAPTITTRFDTPAGGRFIHPVENRTLTPREAARIQSFPDDFVFYGNRTVICRQIGNAVPPKISYFLSRYLDSLLKEAK